MKEFLESYCHPLYPEQPYVASKIYGNATTTKEVLKSLFPQYINYIHYYLLEDIVVTFGCDRAKEVLQQYTDQKYSHKRKLNDQPGPITDGEIEQFHGTKKLKVAMNIAISMYPVKQQHRNKPVPTCITKPGNKPKH